MQVVGVEDNVVALDNSNPMSAKQKETKVTHGEGHQTGGCILLYWPCSLTPPIGPSSVVLRAGATRDFPWHHRASRNLNPFSPSPLISSELWLLAAADTNLYLTANHDSVTSWLDGATDYVLLAVVVIKE